MHTSLLYGCVHGYNVNDQGSGRLESENVLVNEKLATWEEDDPVIITLM